MRKRYIVKAFDSNGKVLREGFTKPGIDAMKRIGLVEFVGTQRVGDCTVYHYTPKGR